MSRHSRPDNSRDVSRAARPPWSAPISVHDVPETGRHVALNADEATRAVLAQLIGLRALPRLNAAFDVSRMGRDGLHVVGRVSATVGQTCVVTLEPIDNEIDETIDVVFKPEVETKMSAALVASQVTEDDPPEPLVGGVVDLGGVATEFLTLAIDPYPKKTDAAFSAPASTDDSPHPFAALAALKKGQAGS